VQAVAPNIYPIESRLGSRRLIQWLITGRDGALLLDTGVAGTVGEHIAPALERAGIAPESIVEVVVSHADVDHYGGNAEVRTLAPHARVRAHPHDRRLIETWDVIASERYGWYRQHGLDYPAASWRWLRDAAGPDTRLDGDLQPGERIDLGGISLETLHLPGHSLGHLGLYEPSSRTAIVADAVMGRGFETVDGDPAGPPIYVDLAGYRDTIALLRDLAPARLATAHFALLRDKEVEGFLDLSERFTDELESALDRTRADDEPSLPRLLARVATELGPYPEMEVELARSIGAHLEAVTSDDGGQRL